MVIVAFLQNLWVKDLQKAQAAFDTHDEVFRRMFLKHLLFSGGLTGKRIQKAFGAELCDSIVWEESTREIADNPFTIFPADLDHIRSVLEELKPDVVITFGMHARAALEKVWTGEYVRLPHPAARMRNIDDRLKLGRKELENIMAEVEKI